MVPLGRRPLSRLKARLRSARTWIALGVLAPVGMVAVSGLMLAELRRDAWERAEQTSRNLLQVLDRDIARNVEIYDLSLQAAVENIAVPGLAQSDARLRQLILFDRAATARDMGVMLVIDAQGDVVADLGALPPRAGNYADRDYFKIHQARDGLGLQIGSPIVSRLTGERMLPFSRRINRPDGSFGGVVLGTVKLSYFEHLFREIDLGPGGAINLYLADGTRIMRYPHTEADLGANIARAATFRRFVRDRQGSFIGTSARDGAERFYAFTQIGALPLILNIALSTWDVEAAWFAKALIIGGITLVLCGLTIALSLLFGRELRRREAAQEELAALSRTDALTGLPNRRRFEETFAAATETARRDGRPLSLLIVDADHFKRYNDRYGHPVGDAILKALARHLAASVHRPQDLVSRIGGEEFAILLPETDAAGAARIADRVHAEVAGLTVPSAGIGAGAVTVSIGLACAGGGRGAAPDLYRLADGALYAAKEGGRNQTRIAATQDPPPQRGSLQLVGRA
ncbi:MULTISPECIES: sensor domain-containing diguanylate cyclase [unclassified Methylobacterium]|jgi:diguanylate cyclase (GGDEF)-like protein|uniref:sensor domain-containing diguanylate cyclase n=1 Tax=unclassified Methylobacterium TaxID=2615210 RepID=UPI001352CDBC|nr:sensor domain-containing diguanylate cyclase [Methylobacterium sp. 2A]MWV20431.1 GGDEF domain-containing protein [Methylobacterium sp. 2A]